MEKEFKKELQNKLGSKVYFTNTEIKNILRKLNKGVSDNAHAWWINKFKNDGFITLLGRGRYTFQQKKDFKPELSRKAKQFYNKVRPLLPKGIPLLVYESYSIADLMGVERKNQYIFLHVPKEHMESFFYDISRLGKRVFTKPDKEVTEKYITTSDEAVILYPFLTDMPLIDQKGYTTLSIEGILVHSVLFGAAYIQTRDMDMKDVFKIALDNFKVNISKLLRYAGRRGLKEEVNAILSELGYN